MKQSPESVNRDLDDEGAEAIEHQYARRLMKSAVQGDSPPPSAGTAKSDKDRFDQEMEELRETSGF
jgi:hypothetical protein